MTRPLAAVIAEHALLGLSALELGGMGAPMSLRVLEALCDSHWLKLLGLNRSGA